MENQRKRNGNFHIVVVCAGCRRRGMILPHHKNRMASKNVSLRKGITIDGRWQESFQCGETGNEGQSGEKF